MSFVFRYYRRLPIFVDADVVVRHLFEFTAPPFIDLSLAIHF